MTHFMLAPSFTCTWHSTGVRLSPPSRAERFCFVLFYFISKPWGALGWAPAADPQLRDTNQTQPVELQVLLRQQTEVSANSSGVSWICAPADVLLNPSCRTKWNPSLAEAELNSLFHKGQNLGLFFCYCCCCCCFSNLWSQSQWPIILPVQIPLSAARC